MIPEKKGKKDAVIPIPVKEKEKMASKGEEVSDKNKKKYFESEREESVRVDIPSDMFMMKGDYETAVTVEAKSSEFLDADMGDDEAMELEEGKKKKVEVIAKDFEQSGKEARLPASTTQMEGGEEGLGEKDWQVEEKDGISMTDCAMIE